MLKQPRDMPSFSFCLLPNEKSLLRPINEVKGHQVQKYVNNPKRNIFKGILLQMFYKVSTWDMPSFGVYVAKMKDHY